MQQALVWPLDIVFLRLLLAPYQLGTLDIAIFKKLDTCALK